MAETETCLGIHEKKKHSLIRKVSAIYRVRSGENPTLISFKKKITE
ncbi:MAG: hypothetical protein ISR78_04460 [Spirochaetia bacterium]|nr:hypothetical protein [Spirochaetia bacterium]